MAVAANICVAWPSTAASIPLGWSRETSLDARYILGAATGADTDLSTDRGNTTHIHTSPSHTPIQDAHTHDFLTNGNDASITVHTGNGAGSGASAAHGHGPDTSDATTATNNGISITVNPTSNDLTFTEVIWIKSDGSPTALPIGCLAFFVSDSLPSGWSRANGNRYLKGAAAAGNGGSTGGSNTHTHTSPAHTHTQTAHQHTGHSSGATGVAILKGLGTDTVSTVGHTHTVILTTVTATNQSVTTTINSGNHEPPFTKLNIVQAASATLPTNIVALWLSTNATIPSGWQRLTAMDGRWLKGANADGESGVTTGGSLQHNHTASDCQPIQDAHSHIIDDPGAPASVSANPGPADDYASPGHTHGAWTDDPTTATNQAIGVTIDLCTSGAALPKHRTVIYVQFTGSVPPGPTITVIPSSYIYGDIAFPSGPEPNPVNPELAQKRWARDLRY